MRVIEVYARITALTVYSGGMALSYRWLKKTPPAVSKKQAIEIAREECDQCGWPWIEPVTVRARRGAWLVSTSDQSRGVNGRFVINQTTGEVAHSVFGRR